MKESFVSTIDIRGHLEAVLKIVPQFGKGLSQFEQKVILI